MQNSNSDPPRVVAYLRCAIDDAERMASQMARIQCRTEHRGWKLVRIYADNGLSGNSANRPALLQLQCDIEAGLVDIVIVERFDSLCRNLQGLSSFVQLVKRCNTTLVSLGEGIVCQQL